MRLTFLGGAAVLPPHHHAEAQLVLLLEVLRCMTSVLYIGNLLIADVS